VRLERRGAGSQSPLPRSRRAAGVDRINRVVGGGAAAVAAGAFLDASLGVAVGVGIAAAVVSVVAWIRYADRLLDAGADMTEPLFPSPSRGVGDRPPS
jgi:hypothetical protein